jgi:asparagine synthase (glutamine-hydrolysing)
MCGIAGIVAPCGQRAEIGAIRAMTNALAHRGPDGEGTWLSPDSRIAFGHRRLAIIDLDRRAGQPMLSWDRRITIVFNGEIYNHAALRGELMARGHRFETRSSDTEVLIEGFRAWGIAGLLDRIDGIFSFVLHDGETQLTHLVRDRYGIKPLYVAWLEDGDRGTALLFASEMRGIASHPRFRARPSWSQVAHYLTFMSVPAPATLLAGVWKVPAGCRLEVDDKGAVRIERYQHAALVDAGRQQCFAQRSDIVHSIRKTLESAVDLQMTADVPVGVMLSGGLDSGAILAEASRRHESLDAYTMAFTDDPESDETALAAETAQRFNARHHVFHLSAEEATSSADHVIAAMDEPQADWVCIPLWHLAKAVSARGGKVILVGEGADEQLVGYEHWRVYLGRIAALAAAARTAGPLAGLIGAGLARLGASNLGLRTRADFLSRAARRGELFWGGAVLCWPLVLEAIWNCEGAGKPLQPLWMPSEDDATLHLENDAALRVASWYGAIDRLRPQADVVTRMIGIEFLQRLPELLLMRVDKMTMAHGVEARVPFLARPMVDLSFEISGADKLAGTQTKALLREAFEDVLPRSVVAARKRGFGAPVDRWLRGPFGTAVMDEIRGGALAPGLQLAVVETLMRQHRQGDANHAGVLWALFVLSRWLAMSVPHAALRLAA